MKLTRGLALKLAALVVLLGLTAAVSMVFGALGKHSARFPLNYINEAADVVWQHTRRKIGTRYPPPVQTADDVKFTTTYTTIRGHIFKIPIAERGGEGGATTSIGNTLVLMTHDGRFFAGTAETGFRRIEGIKPPPNGFQAYYDRTHRAPFDPAMQNYANFRYNDIGYFSSAAGAGLLISHTYFDGEKDCYVNRVSRLEFSGRNAPFESMTIAASDWRGVFDTAPCLKVQETGPGIRLLTAGGRMLIESETGTLYLTNGTYDSPNPNGSGDIAQDPTTDYGKVIAIDMATWKSRVVSRGHRNPQGIAKDDAGRIWTVEHGPRAGDELNLIVDGENYGWPLVTYGTAYDQTKYHGALELGRHDGFREPVLTWLPSIAPSTIMVVHGFNQAWDGNLLVGGLSGERMVHIRIVDNRVVYAEDIPVGRRVRHLHQHTDGTIALWNGKDELIILTPEGPSNTAQIAEAIIQKLDVSDRVRAAVRSKLGDCMQCHSLDTGDHASAPPLARVFGSGVASGAYPRYSAALTKAGGEWTKERLNAFLRNPEGTFPGTNMPNPELADDEIRAAMINLLAELKHAHD